MEAAQAGGQRQPQEASVWMQGSAPATRLQAAHPMARSTWHDPIPTRCFLGSPRPESAEDLGQSCSCQLEVSHVGRSKVKRAKAPHRRRPPHNQGTQAIPLATGKLAPCSSKLS